MIYLIIGHRGTGKTSWLKKIKKVFKHKVTVLDLDQEIIKSHPSWRSIQPQNKKTLKNKNSQQMNEWLLKDQTRFRQIEKKVLTSLIRQHQSQKKDTFIAIGAGAKIPYIKRGYHVLHLMRETDPDGRVFLDRPRLIQKLSPYKEYLHLYSKREKYYQQVRDESFMLPEQDLTSIETEKIFFGLKNRKLGASLTLNKHTLPKDSSNWPDFINRRLKWGIRFFEFRDDEWNLNSLQKGKGKQLLKLIPKEKQLFSSRPLQRGLQRRDSMHTCYDFIFLLLICKTCRSSLLKKLLKTSSALRALRAKRMSELLNSFFKREDISLCYCKSYKLKSPTPTWDCTVELFNCGHIFFCKPPILSAHNRNGKSLRQICKNLLKYKAHHYKLAVPIKNLKELLEGHLWFLEDPHHRSFLPISSKQMSDNMKSCRWYRQIFGPQMHLNFIRESRKQGLKDQAFLYEIAGGQKQLPTPANIKFGAVLGTPIAHSASPAFYRKIFNKNKMLFTKIPITEKELTKKHLRILQKMGLIFAAVTSPLKKQAAMICNSMDINARKFKSVNTLIFKNNKWFGSNTDIFGVKTLLQAAGLGKTFHQTQTVVWGGGGTRSVLRHILPLATFYSARSKKKTFGKKQNTQPVVIIWAVGRSRMSERMFPSAKWRPKIVIDLNYTADSPGREYAIKTGAKYISGMQMFQAQAKKQKELLLKYNLIKK